MLFQSVCIPKHRKGNVKRLIVSAMIAKSRLIPRTDPTLGADQRLVTQVTDWIYRRDILRDLEPA